MAQLPIVNLGNKYIFGLGLTRASSLTVLVGSGAARNSTNEVDIVLEEDTNLIFNVEGVNGLDEGSISINTMYAVYLIGDSTRHNSGACVASLSFDGPVLPEGYDVFRRIGAVAIGTTAVLKNFSQRGSGSARTMIYWDDVSVISGGNPTAYTNIDLSASVPPIPTQVCFMYAYTPNTANNTLRFNVEGSLSSLGVIRVGSGVAAEQQGPISTPIDVVGGVPIANYRVTQGTDSVDLSVKSYVDGL